MEQECLSILLKGKQPVIVCPARSIENMRLKAEHKTPLAVQSRVRLPLLRYAQKTYQTKALHFKKPLL